MRDDEDSRGKRSSRERRTRGSRPIRRKICKFCAEHVGVLDYKDVGRLSKFLTERGKILPARISGSCAKHQRTLTEAIKRARFVALLPYIAE